MSFCLVYTHKLSVFDSQQAQVYFAGASRYVGVFNTSWEAANAYTKFKEYLKSYKKGASDGSYSKQYVSQLVDQGRHHAMMGVLNNKASTTATASNANNANSSSSSNNSNRSSPESKSKSS